MSIVQEIQTWLWVPGYWLLAYSVLSVVAIGAGMMGWSSLYWLIFLVGVPLIIIPATYRSLIGTGCSVRFQICALVKGMLAGFIFFAMTMFADIVIWSFLGSSFGWSPLIDTLTSRWVYQVWLYSGFLGGIGARVIEVRMLDMNEPMITQ